MDSVADTSESGELPQRLAAAWPVEQWRGVHVLAAVSGGADSVALLRALAAAKRNAGGTGEIFAAHVNHQLRADADAHEAWVRGQCELLGVRCVTRRVCVTELHDKQGDGVEAAARAARYAALIEMAEEVGARFVATGHTLDDQAETVLFRLVRGSGLRGLAGMPRVRALAASVTLVRPLLGVRRAELEAYLAQIGQAWLEDSTNSELRFSRNKIRAEVLPLLRERLNSDADAAIARAAERMGEAQDLIESLAEELLAACRVEVGGERIALLATPLQAAAPLLAIEALRAAWRDAGWPEQAMTQQWWRDLGALARDAGDGRALNLPGNVLARREGDALVLARLA
jgi:tRNA(Ile)-lysidine synthase